MELESSAVQEADCEDDFKKDACSVGVGTIIMMRQNLTKSRAQDKPDDDDEDDETNWYKSEITAGCIKK